MHTSTEPQTLHVGDPVRLLAGPYTGRLAYVRSIPPAGIVAVVHLARSGERLQVYLSDLAQDEHIATCRRILATAADGLPLAETPPEVLVPDLAAVHAAIDAGTKYQWAIRRPFEAETAAAAAAQQHAADLEEIATETSPDLTGLFCALRRAFDTGRHHADPAAFN